MRFSGDFESDRVLAQNDADGIALDDAKLWGGTEMSVEHVSKLSNRTNSVPPPARPPNPLSLSNTFQLPRSGNPPWPGLELQPKGWNRVRMPSVCV